jgi:hypothetical protein
MLRTYFECESCGWSIAYGEVYWGLVELAKTAGVETCPKCKQELSRVIRDIRVGKVFGINNAPYPKPLHSDALGIQPDQVTEHREMFPDVELDSERRPVFTNANQHDAYMEKAGIRKDVQKTRRPGEVIAKLESEDEDRRSNTANS